MSWARRDRCDTLIDLFTQEGCHDHRHFRVPDINTAAERITANGGKILNGPTEVPGGDWVVNAMDPQGAAFSLHATKAQ
jgi:predicted enzyme related to lactoylglutathione lyase